MSVSKNEKTFGNLNTLFMGGLKIEQVKFWKKEDKKLVILCVRTQKSKTLLYNKQKHLNQIHSFLSHHNLNWHEMTPGVYEGEDILKFFKWG